MIEQYICDHGLNQMRLAGRKVGADRSGDRVIQVFNPYTEERIGSVPKATLDLVAKREKEILAGTFTVKVDDSQPKGTAK